MSIKTTGPVFTPGDQGYDAEIAGFQTAVATRPSLVVGAETAEDVAAAVRYAADHGLPVAVQATGHGLIEGTEGVLITTRRLDHVEIDPATATARVGAGVRWGAVIEAAAAHGLAPLSGSSPDVGVVGYTLNGGFGLMARKFGRAADHVRGVDVVLPDGSQQHQETHESGIVTSLEFGLVPVTGLYGGGLHFGPDHLGDVLRAWRDWALDAPDELTTSVALIPFPDLPMVPEPLRGKHIAHVRVAYLGTDGERLVAPMRAAAPALLDSLTTMPFTKSGTIAAEPPNPHGYAGDNATVRELTDDMLSDILDLAGPDAAVPTVLLIDRLGGALSAWDKESVFTVRGLSVVGEAGPEPLWAAHGKLFDALAPATTGRLPGFVYGPRPLSAR